MKTKMKIATAALIVIAAGSAIGVAPAKAAGIELDRVDITFKREDTEAHYGPHGGPTPPPPPPHYGEPRGPHGHRPPPPQHHGDPRGFAPPEPHRGGHMPPPPHYGEPRGPHGGHMPPPPPYGGPHGPHGR